MKKRRNFIIVLIILVLIIFGGILILINSKFGRDLLRKRDLRKLTNTFYSYYYDDNNTDNDIKSFLKKYESTGLNISLGDMEVYIESKSNGGTKFSTLEKCDRANTKINIYPKDPYNKSDYELKFDLVCK